MIFAQGSRFGGHALFVKDRKLHYVYNFLGLRPSSTSSPRRWRPAGTCSESVHAESRASAASRTAPRSCSVEADGRTEGALRTQTGLFALGGEGLSIGRDTGSAVSEQYTPGSSSGRHDPPSRDQRRATTPTSTSNNTWPQRWRATDHFSSPRSRRYRAASGGRDPGGNLDRRTGAADYRKHQHPRMGIDQPPSADQRRSLRRPTPAARISPGRRRRR